MAKKEALFEKVQFQDTQRATRALAMAKFNQIRILIGFVISLVAMVFTILAIWGNPEKTSTFVGVAVFLAIPAYIIGGGILNALKIAWKITKFGWFLIPTFPADILISIACFFFAVLGLLFVPVIFVGFNYIQHKRNLDEARSYLAMCGVSEDATEEEKVSVEE